MTAPLARLKELFSDKETTKYFQQRLDISILGYEDYSKELFEIQEVRNYLQELDEQFPFWFYFLNNIGTGLKLITFSCISCRVVGKKLHFDTLEMQNFINYHFARMNQICEFAGMTKENNKLLTEMVLANFR